MGKLSDWKLICRTWAMSCPALGVATLLPMPVLAVEIPSAVDPSA